MFFADCTEHPYKAEIDALLKSPVVEFDEGNVGDLELRDSYVWIETESQLVELVDVLSQERLFAVDTEQHGLRSFLGFTALIQVTTLVISLSFDYTDRWIYGCVCTLY